MASRSTASASHVAIDLSCEPERIVLPSGEKATEATRSLCELSSVETWLGLGLGSG